MLASVTQSDVRLTVDQEDAGFDTCRGRQYSFVEIDNEIFSTVILSLPLIKEGQLLILGERICTVYGIQMTIQGTLNFP